MSIASRPDRQRCIPALIATFMVVFGAAPIHAGAAASDKGAPAIAALDAVPAGDWLKQSSAALLDRVIAASSKESLDAAAAKDPRAQALVGSAHLSGLHGYAKSESEAVRFYRLAADSNPIAQNNLGNLLQTGVANGGKPAPAEAAEMFRRAAKQGHPVAQANLGKFYADGVGVEKDVAKAKEFLTLAAAQGNPDAAEALDLLEKREAAEKWKRLEAAAAKGDANAIRELAEAYEAIDKKAFEEIKSNQVQAAVSTIMKAPDREKLRFVERVDEHGMTALHWAARNRNASAVRWLLDKGPELELKDDQGRTPLMIAFDNLDTNSMTLLINRGANTATALPGHDEKLKELSKDKTTEIVDFMLNTLGLSYYEGKGVAKDQAKSAEIFAIGCEAGGARTCHNLGIQNSRGEGLPKDIAKAVALFEKACAAGYAQACTNAGYYYFLGDGLPRDAAKAVQFYEKGCAGEDRAGCHNLGVMLDAGKGIPGDKARAKTLFVKACNLGQKEACDRLTAAPAASAAQSKAPVATGSVEPCKLVKVLLGVDTVASVERDVKARGGAPSVGGTGSDGKFRMSTLSGDYSDGGPAIMAVNYDFDAASPSGKLVAVTVVRKVDFGAPYAKLVAERKAFLSNAFGELTAKSATESTGARPGCTLALYENPDTGFLYELYKLAK